ncbi:MAG: hypothetical protein INH43_24350 [Acidobacteriaceae bacterium]|nr:hypothetical protein [Acidobacteriaceae bacterium]
MPNTASRLPGDDARGRLAQVTAAGGTTSFTINALGERITKSGPLTPGGMNVFHYDPTGKLIATSVAGQDNWTDIVYLGNTPVAMLTGAAATPAIVNAEVILTPCGSVLLRR